mgnify:CR=1 FL=1
MSVKEIALACLISAMPMAGAKAQKVVLTAESGITGIVKNDALYYGGLNCNILSGKNFSDVYVGMNLNANKEVGFTSLIIENYPWTKNFSSWARGIFSASKSGQSFTGQFAPLKASTQVGKFDFSVTPSLEISRDFKAKTTTTGFTPIFQTTYQANSNDMIFFEAAYSTSSQNGSYMLSLIHTIK